MAARRIHKSLYGMFNTCTVAKQILSLISACDKLFYLGAQEIHK